MGLDDIVHVHPALWDDAIHPDGTGPYDAHGAR